MCMNIEWMVYYSIKFLIAVAVWGDKEWRGVEYFEEQCGKIHAHLLCDVHGRMTNVYCISWPQRDIAIVVYWSGDKWL